MPPGAHRRRPAPRRRRPALRRRRLALRRRRRRRPSHCPACRRRRRRLAHRSDSQNAALASAWAWAATLKPETLPALPGIGTVRRIPRSVLLDFQHALVPLLERLDANPHDTAANCVLYLMPRMVLRRDPPKDNSTVGRRRAAHAAALREHAEMLPAGDCIAARVLRFANGEWERLLSDYHNAVKTEEKLRLSPGKDADGKLKQLRAHRKCDRLTGQNELSRATAAVVDQADTVPDAASAYSFLYSKHPADGLLQPGEAALISGAVQMSKAPLQLTVDSMRFALARSSRGTSPGPSGWTSEAWRDLCEDERTLEAITRYINGSFCKGQLPRPLMQMWGACNTIALTKPKGGYRPISMGETLRRLTGKAAIHQLKEDINTHLAPLQWGVGAPRGCATIVNTLRTYIQRHPDHVILKCDISNAFNCQRRFAFLDAVQTSLPALLPLAAQFYIARDGTPAPRPQRDGHVSPLLRVRAAAG